MILTHYEPEEREQRYKVRQLKMEKENEKEDTIPVDTTSPTNKDEGDDVTLPGFRFHPTDDELVGFYLRRKVGKKPLKVELVKQLDIYKFDPWDLPKTSRSSGDKERYFFCKRGRKYRNSVRPNRVTGSGFWKATGIDKPVHAKEGDCIGLKKTLVYYRGSAGKGTKTDWMMHEFRLPSTNNSNSNNNNTTIAAANKNSLQEAEVWTLCRILKRNTSYKKYTADWKELSNRRQLAHNASSINSISVMDDSTTRENYMCFSAPEVLQQYDQKPNVLYNYNYSMGQWDNFLMSTSNSQPTPSSSMASSSSNFPVSPYGNEFFSSGDWDELGSMVDFALNHVENSSSIRTSLDAIGYKC